MDKQWYESARLTEEGRFAIPSTISTVFLEADAPQLYTRPIFYKVQEEILACCYDMRITDIGPLIDGIKTYQMKDVKMNDKWFEVKISQYHAECSCKKFVMCGILCRHAFCALNQFEVVKIPRNLVLNRWSRIAEHAPSSKFLGVFDDFGKVDNVSLKVTNIWFNFQKTMNKAGVDIDKLSHVEKTVKQLGSDLGDDSVLTKKAQLQEMMGPQPTEEIVIRAPNQCKKKGLGLKRFFSHREKAIMELNNRGSKKVATAEVTTIKVATAEVEIELADED
ncbi:hypothetical protein POM88_044151 [Heracleum sosnowskyi]|uniref:Protein FAR1-RELATED SEQUENCE n=1 Tax=Heracleum sosnowskyi TaxID=360622 RepID=A0AAD8H297_9APIA|nr:hypothetical protein POM88_044151 [Heracleum sosnowskyi]